MKARDDYRLLVTRSGAAPAVFASRGRIDHVEIVEVSSGEVVLFWDCAPREATQLARELGRDLAELDPEAFIARWNEIAEQAP